MPYGRAGSSPADRTSEVVQLQRTAAISPERTAQGSNRSSNDARQNPLTPYAEMAELADALDSKSSVVRRVGSSPTFGTSN